MTKEPRLINGKSIINFLLIGLCSSLIFFLTASWGFNIYLNDTNRYYEAANSLEPLLITHTTTYGFLIGAFGIFILASILLNSTLWKVFECNKMALYVKTEKILVACFIAAFFLMAPITIGGHFLTKYQITQKGYYYCGSLRLKDRFRGAFVLEEVDCYDDHLQRIMLQYGKNNQLILEEAHRYLREKQKTQAEQG
ncbi:MFS transporter [Nitrincola iocasae]|uniref:MFS transporter n=1 Tax=Nitrincola iocasae TaxID=2614693 RepID=A0A5J6LIQ9_9GAMM|nr:MFS transporter [Nitrincola iocasae]QEW08001.1 MFS transporter [Nitrincola iocasae]